MKIGHITTKITIDNKITNIKISKVSINKANGVDRANVLIPIYLLMKAKRKHNIIEQNTTNHHLTRT